MHISFVVFMLMSAICGAADLRDSLWFFADFDRSTQMAGSTFGQKLSGDGYCEGRFGKGYHFHRPAINVLPPMKEFLTDKWMHRTPDSIEFEPVDVKMKRSCGAVYTAVTCSFFVKGAKGTEVTLVAEMLPLSTNDLAAADKAASYGFNHANMFKDHAGTNVVCLSGDWQRVWVAARHDFRLEVTRKVKLSVRATAPIEVERFQYEQSASYPYFYNEYPTLWVDGGMKNMAGGYQTTDRTRVDSFPVEEGAYSFWVKSDPLSVAMKGGCTAWSYSKPWAENWTGGAGFLQSFRGCSVSGKGAARSTEWHHYAGVWSNGCLAVYIDGEKKGERVKDVKLDPMKADNVRTFYVGAYGTSAASSDAIMDEFAIFSRALTDDEVMSLAKAEKGLLDHENAFLMGAIELPYYWRNEKSAALKFTLSAPKAGKYKAEAFIGDMRLGDAETELGFDAREVRIPFDPSVKRPGKYTVLIKVSNAEGSKVFERETAITIRGIVNRDRFLMMSWGGTGYEKFLSEKVGLNGVNIWVGGSMLQEVRTAAEYDMNVNFRYENSGAPETIAHDLATIENKADKALAPFAGWHLWTSTLLNSEVWGFDRAKRVWKTPEWVKTATEALGHEPSYAITDSAPTEMDYKKAGIKPHRGVIPDNEPTLDTLTWMNGRGSPLYDDHLTLSKVIKRHSPGNMVWSEPICAGGFMECIDMGSGWYYEYGTADMLGHLLRGSGNTIGHNRYFQPTLAMNYWPEVKGRANGKVVDLGQTADELMVKSWMSIAAVPAHSLSFFTADWGWGKGEAAARIYETNKTAKIERICQIGDPARYGEFVRTRFIPAAELFKDMPNVRAPFAVAVLNEPEYLGSFWYGHYHHVTHVPALLVRKPGAFDMIPDAGFTVENLSKYKYVYVPMLKCVTKSHDAAIREAAEKGTKFVFDVYCTNSYPNAEMTKITYRYPFRKPDCEDPLYDFYTNRFDELSSALPAWSATDGTTSYTFSKEFKDVTYVTVINNARRPGGCVQTELNTNAWYQPCTAPQRITTRLNKKGVIYEFNVDGGRKVSADKNGEISFDYAASEAKIFCIYPEELKAPELKLVREQDNARTSKLLVSVKAKSGEFASGRTIVRLKLTDPKGNICDESGIYTMENGQVEIPIRFAVDDPASSFMSKWKAVVTDLTSGLDSSIKF